MFGWYNAWFRLIAYKTRYETGTWLIALWPAVYRKKQLAIDLTFYSNHGIFERTLRHDSIFRTFQRNRLMQTRPVFKVRKLISELALLWLLHVDSASVCQVEVKLGYWTGILALASHPVSLSLLASFRSALE